MIERRGDARLAQQPAVVLVGALFAPAQHLQRHRPVQAQVLGQPDLAHPAPAEQRPQLVAVGEDGAGEGSLGRRIEGPRIRSHAADASRDIVRRWA